MNTVARNRPAYLLKTVKGLSERVRRAPRAAMNLTPESTAIIGRHDPLVVVQVPTGKMHLPHPTGSNEVGVFWVEARKTLVDEFRSCVAKEGQELGVAVPDNPVCRVDHWYGNFVQRKQCVAASK